MLVIVQTENVNLFGKVVKDDVDMTGNKKTLRNVQVILLFKKSDLVAVAGELIA